MKKLFIIPFLFLLSCGQTAPDLDNKIIVVEGKSYSVKTAGGKLYYIYEVEIVSDTLNK